MKHNFLLAALLSAVFSSMTAQAASTSSIEASAEVLGVCQFKSDVGTINFGILEPVRAGTNLTSNNLAAGEVTYECTKGTTPIFVLNGGNPESFLVNANDPTARIKYTFNPGFAIPVQDAVGRGFGVEDLLVRAVAQIENIDVANAKVGYYTDTVFLTMTE
jgi:spore coat protein U-like protein